MTSLGARSRVSSPCINVCTMDPVRGLCTGCGRTIAEIAGWSSMDEPARRAVMAELPGRLQALPVITFWFDPISPYACLAFERLPQVLEGIAYAVSYRPVLFAGLLQHWGQLGPAEIGPKRAWTYRDVLWRAKAHGLSLQLPAAHPFNPLPLLRLAMAAAGEDGWPGRAVVARIFRHVWQGAADGAPQAADDPQRLAALRAAIAPRLDPDGDAVRSALRRAGEQAVSEGVFGVPTLVLRGRTYWGDDALPMLRQALLAGDEAVLPGEQWKAAERLPIGVARR